MQEVNVCILSGNVSEVQYTVTEKRGDDAASFMIYVDRDDEHTTVARVNVFGQLVNLCRDYGLGKGDFIIIKGELMNRHLRNFGAALEIKACDIKVLNKPRQGSRSPKVQTMV